MIFYPLECKNMMPMKHDADFNIPYIAIAHFQYCQQCQNSQHILTQNFFLQCFITSLEQIIKTTANTSQIDSNKNDNFTTSVIIRFTHTFVISFVCCKSWMGYKIRLLVCVWARRQAHQVTEYNSIICINSIIRIGDQIELKIYRYT